MIFLQEVLTRLVAHSKEFREGESVGAVVHIVTGTHTSQRPEQLVLYLVLPSDESCQFLAFCLRFILTIVIRDLVGT